MTICALNETPDKHGLCINENNLKEIASKVVGNTAPEIKAELGCADDKNPSECIIENAPISQEDKDRMKREDLKALADGLDNNYWLNNTEIDTIMSQLRKRHAGFAHGFIHMSDLKDFKPTNYNSFDYKVYPVIETDFANEFKHGLIKAGRLKGTTDYTPKLSTYNDVPLTSYGVVCNTDSSKGSGQHWFVIYISTDQRDPDNTSRPWIRIECFNSAGGGSSNAEFNEFWQTQAMSIARATGLRCTYDTISSIQHQRDDTGNCGSYSLFYIYSRLKDCHPSEFDNPNKKILDHSMRKFREVCFRVDKSN